MKYMHSVPPIEIEHIAMARGFTLNGEFCSSWFSVQFFRLFIRIFWNKSKSLLWKAGILIMIVIVTILDNPSMMKLSLMLLGFGLIASMIADVAKL
jgi:hypothetical protein